MLFDLREVWMPEDISLLIAELSSPSPRQRAAAAEKLSRMGEQARGAVVPLVRLAGDEDEETREWAVAALEELGEPPPEDGPALVKLLEAPSADSGYWAATLLGRLGPVADGDAVSGLAHALDNSPHLPVRERCAWALGKIGPAASAAKGSLERARQMGNARLQRLAEQALVQIGG